MENPFDALERVQSELAQAKARIAELERQIEQNALHQKGEQHTASQPTQDAPGTPTPSASEDVFRMLFENNPHNMWVYDLETLRFLEVNHAAVEFYGFSRDEFLSMRITDIRPQEDVTRLLDDTQSRRSPFQRSGEWRHRLKNGRIVDVEITSHTLQFAGRHAVLVVARDITERKNAEAALHTSEERFRSLISAVNAHLYVTKITREKTFINEYLSPRVTEIAGLSPQRFLEDWNLWLILVHPEDLSACETQLQKLMAGQSSKVEYRISMQDGRDMWVQDDARVVPHPNGTITVFATVIDITERKQAELARVASEQKLRLFVEYSPAAIVRTMIQQARQKIVVADHSKIGITARARICGIDRIDTLITGIETPGEQASAFEQAGIKVIRV